MPRLKPILPWISTPPSRPCRRLYFSNLCMRSVSRQRKAPGCRAPVTGRASLSSRVTHLTLACAFWNQQHPDWLSSASQRLPKSTPCFGSADCSGCAQLRWARADYETGPTIVAAKDYSKCFYSVGIKSSSEEHKTRLLYEWGQFTAACMLETWVLVTWYIYMRSQVVHTHMNKPNPSARFYILLLRGGNLYRP